MNPDDSYSIWVQAFALIVILTPTIAFIAFRRSIGVMNAAAGLVIWGALTACGEHGYWAMRHAIDERLFANPHSTVHYFMAGVYAAIAGVLLSVIALTVFREGRRSGWFAVLFALLVGGGLELVMNGPTGYLYHHIGLYGYPLAWAAALVIAYKPTFMRLEERELDASGHSQPTINLCIRRPAVRPDPGGRHRLKEPRPVAGGTPISDTRVAAQ